MMPPHSESRLSGIALARDAIQSGQLQVLAQHVQPWIAQSWQRCLSDGHSPFDRLGFDAVGANAQRHYIESNRILREAARYSLVQLGDVIAQTSYFAILTNAQGTVVDTSGLIDHSDPRADAIARIGIDLSETAVGTTTIGTTLIEQRNTWLHRGEHFYQDANCYSCAGAPITGPDGRCAGMVDVTGIDVEERPALMHLVATSARAIENALVLAQPHTLVLHLQWPGQRSGKDNEGLLCVDTDGVIGAMNPMARQMLGLMYSTSASLHMGDVFAVSAGHLFDTRLNTAWIAVPLWSGLHLHVRTSQAGTFAPKLPAIQSAIELTKPLKDQETALIKRTVTQLKGNVAAAAAQLGISRSTIYRKLGKPKR
jgi:sigma-54 dependent transcriptional regulator, acetoin dehydrogenase operon transcriptional activator AcoR